MKKNTDWFHSGVIIEILPYMPPFWPKIEVEPVKFAKKFKSLGVTAIQTGPIGKCAYYPTDAIWRHPDLGNRDLFGEIVEECHKAGLKIICYMPACHQLPYQPLKRYHPEWMFRPAPRKELPYNSLHLHIFGGPHYPLCFNSPYKEAFFTMVKEVVTRYEIDAIFFDAWQRIYFAPWQPCYCNTCRKMFKDRYGEEMPLVKGGPCWSTGKLKFIGKYSSSQRKNLNEWFKEYSSLSWKIAEETVKLVKKYRDIPIFCHGEYYLCVRDKFQGYDGYLLEAIPTLDKRYVGIRLIRNERKIVYPFIDNYNGYFRVITAKKELILSGLITYLTGGIPLSGNGYGYYYAPEKSLMPMKKLSHLIKRIQQTCGDMELMKFIALPVPDFIRYYYREEPDGDPDMVKKVESALMGGLRLCLSNHLPVDCISQSSLEDFSILSKYRILYLPSTPVLTKSEVETVKKYVRNGGILIATGICSLLDKKGKIQKNFALKDILGISKREPDTEEKKILDTHRWAAGPSDIYLKIVSKHNFFKDKNLPELFEQDQFQLINLAKNAKVLANIVTGTGYKILSPGIILINFGKGKVLYISGTLENLYIKMRSSIIKDLFHILISGLFNKKLPFETNLPDTVFLIPWISDKSLVVHLVNHTGSIHEGLPGENWPFEPPRLDWISYVEETYLDIKIPENQQIKKVDEIENRGSLNYVKSKNRIRIKLPKFQEYLGIKIDFK